WLARTASRLKETVATLTNLPLILPPVVTGYSLLLLLGPASPVGTLLDQFGIPLAFHWSGAAVAAAVMGFPLLVRTGRLTFESLDPALDQMAATLGLSPMQRLLRLSLPQALPGILAAISLALAKAMGEFGATVTFVASIPGQTRTLPLAIYEASQTPGSESLAITLALVSASTSLIVLFWAEQWIRRTTAPSASRDLSV
ncbi:MAG: molybdate ABC transporter permease subunit, partial [Asticcacaulis sp.]